MEKTILNFHFDYLNPRLMANAHGGRMDCVQFGRLKVASISDTTTVQKVSRWAHKNRPIRDHHFVFLYHSCMPGPSYYFFQPLAGYIFVPQSLLFESTQSQSNPVHCPLWALQSWINNQQQEMELSEPSTNLLLPIDNLKGIVPQKKNHCLNLIFWVVMGCGKAHFGRRGIKTT